MDKNTQKQFETSYQEYAQGIFRYVYFKISDYEKAADITEETFVKYYKVLQKKGTIVSHKALLYTIAKGLIIDEYRKKKRIKISLDHVDERLLGVFDATEESLSQKQDVENVYRVMQTLSSNYQEILLLHFVEDLTIKEIASMQRKKENAVRVSLHRALQELKKKL